MDSSGARLTGSGWYEAAKFFVKPVRPPRQMTISVTDGERIDGPSPWPQGGKNRVRFQVGCRHLGRIDSSGRFSAVDPSFYGPAPTFRMYDLVLTGTYWELRRDEESPHEVSGSPEWRIEGSDPEPWVTFDVAVRYLQGLRDHSKSATVRRNASRSIAALLRVRDR